jgi:hypothetical protein
MYDIRTIDQLILALGGPVLIGRKFGISQEAVSNWGSRGNIPGGWHVQLYAMAARQGLTVDPSVFNLTEEDVAGLFGSASANANGRSQSAAHA